MVILSYVVTEVVSTQLDAVIELPTVPKERMNPKNFVVVSYCYM